MAPFDLTANALAKALAVDAPRINDIVRQQRAISPDTALRLARYFGTTAEFWMTLQSRYDLSIAAAETGNEIERRVDPRAA